MLSQFLSFFSQVASIPAVLCACSHGPLDQVSAGQTSHLRIKPEMLLEVGVRGGSESVV